MGDVIISRRGGTSLSQALAPTITEVSTTANSITFTITNNDAQTAVIVYEVGDTTPDENSIELAAGATSGNLTISGLAGGVTNTVYAFATVFKKIKSDIVELEITTDTTFTAATGGTTEEYDLDGKRYKSHTLTSNGTFEVTAVGDTTGDRNKVDYLIIAGGAGGGSGTNADAGGGGGGAGGYRSTITPTSNDVTPNAKVTVTATSYSVTIGAGGSGSNNDSNAGSSGTNSSVAFPSTITSTGGGGGASRLANGIAGGSGGGGGYMSSGAVIRPKGLGTAGQGFDGGNAVGGASSVSGGGGGGGAGAVGVNATSSVIGAGGIGLNNLLRIGTNEIRAGGGGGGALLRNPAGIGGSGGGGNGKGNGVGSPATANTGGGGGGGGRFNTTGSGGSGGSGIVIIRYEIPTV